MLDDDQGVTEVAQPDERLDEASVVPLVQPDRGLVEDVEDADQPRSDLGGESDPLRLPAGQRAGGTVQGQVVEPDVEQEGEPRVDLLEDAAGDRPLPFGEIERAQELGAFPDGHTGYLGDRTTAQGHRQRLGFEPGAAAGRAGDVAHVALVALTAGLRLCLPVPAAQERHDPLEGREVLSGPAVAVGVGDLDLGLPPAVQDGLAGAFGQTLPGDVHPETEIFGEGLQQPGEVFLVVAG